MPGSRGDNAERGERLFEQAMALLAGRHGLDRVVHLLTEAAALGHPAAANQLGAMYQHGDVVAKDLKRAAALYAQAASADLALGQFNLGFLFHHGLGLDQDLVTAREWYQAAADQGEPTAQLNLGVMYARGEGGFKDRTRAHELWEAAAWAGEAMAAYNLGVAHAGGHDVGIDFGQAYYWFTIAGRLGHMDSTAALSRIIPVMTDEERAYARERLAATDT